MAEEIVEDNYRWKEFFDNYSGPQSTSIANLKQEFISIAASIANAAKAKVEKEREVSILTLELTTIRDQIKGSRQATQENIASQHAIREQMENLSVKGRDNTMRELSHREEIVKLSSQFDSLRNAISVGSGWTPDQDEQRNVLLREREFMAKKLENLTTSVNILRNEIGRITTLMHDSESNSNRIDEEKQALQVKIATLNRQAAGIIGDQHGLSKRIADVQDAIQQAQVDLVERGNVKRQADKTLSSLDSDLVTSKAQMAEYLRDYDALLQTLQDMTVSLTRQKTLNKNSYDELQEREKSLQIRLKDVENMRKENSKLNDLKEIAKKKLLEVEVEKKELEEKKEELISRTDNIREVLIRAAQRDLESQNRQRAACRTELAIIKKKHYNTDHVVSSLEDVLQINRNASKNLTFEKASLQKSIEMQQMKIDSILNEKDKLDIEAEGINQKYYTELEELKLQELQVKELQKKITEDSSKLKQKQNIYEVVRSDRNLYSKQLVELQTDISTLKTTFRQMNHKIDQQKEDISIRDNLIVKEHFLHHSVEKERELLKNQLIKSRKQVLSSRDIVENQQVEIIKLSRIISEADQERFRQRNELSSVMAERNLLTSQVVKRNAELEAVYSKIKVQRNSLRQGERQFDKLMEAIFILHHEIVALVKDKQQVITEMSSYSDLKRQFIALQNELSSLHVKSRALYDELDLPMNIHRWRLLESADPYRYELICRIQELQKQLIVKSDAVVEKEYKIKEYERGYVELKAAISRQPGPEVEEQILVYQQTLKDKGRQLKSMEEECEMYRQQVSIFNSEISAIDADMDKLKKKWFKSIKSKV